MVLCRFCCCMCKNVRMVQHRSPKTELSKQIPHSVSYGNVEHPAMPKVNRCSLPQKLESQTLSECFTGPPTLCFGLRTPLANCSHCGQWTLWCSSSWSPPLRDLIKALLLEHGIQNACSRAIVHVRKNPRGKRSRRGPEPGWFCLKNWTGWPKHCRVNWGHEQKCLVCDKKFPHVPDASSVHFSLLVLWFFASCPFCFQSTRSSQHSQVLKPKTSNEFDEARTIIRVKTVLCLLLLYCTYRTTSGAHRHHGGDLAFTGSVRQLTFESSSDADRVLRAQLKNMQDYEVPQCTYHTVRAVFN